jgi:biopolymer transport protein ExbD
MQRSLWKQTPTIARINVTPIIDVSLVLVIILLITAPMISVQDLGVNLPQAMTRGAEDEARVMLTLGKNGELALDDKRISPESLPALLGSRLAGDKKDMLVVVRADEETPFVAVRTLLSQVRSAGANRIAFATRQKVSVDR